MYDGRAAGARIEVFRSLASCKQTAIGDTAPRLDATCGKVFTGYAPRRRRLLLQRRMREPRNLRQPDLFVGGCCAGTCLARPTPVPLGGDCSSPLQNQDRIEGTVCAANATGGGTCKAPLAAGARCGPYDRCVRPYRSGGTRSRHQRRNLHRPSRPGTGLRYVGQLRRQPRRLRPDHERVHQPDRRGRRLLRAGRLRRVRKVRRNDVRRDAGT